MHPLWADFFNGDRQDGSIRQHCRTCRWERTIPADRTYGFIEECPECANTMIDVTLLRGGVNVAYDGLFDRFFVSYPDYPEHKVQIDNGDAPTVLAFMLKQFRFNHWR
jgi:hypothetical protein